MGEYVSLGKVESILKIHPLIDNICVCAKSTESFTVALVVPDETRLRSLEVKAGMTFEDLCSDDKVTKEVLTQLQDHGLSMGCEKFEIPKKVILIPELWTPDSGMVTAAMKLKRKEIEKRYAMHIEQMYSASNQTTKIDMLKAANNNKKIAPI